MCVRARLAALPRDRGFIASAQFDDILSAGHTWFGPRTTLETDESYRQVVPYIVLRHDDRIAYYVRGESGGEGRLRGRLSIGFGGHVSIGDLSTRSGVVDVDATLNNAAARELSEEVLSGRVIARHRIGLICEEETSVGRVHLGVIEVWSVESGILSPNESNISECGFSRPGDLMQAASRMESWSLLTLRHILTNGLPR